MGAVQDLLKQHIPSLSDENDAEIDTLRFSVKGNGELEDNAALAIRTCSCGRRIEDFYDYAMTHLPEVFEAAGYER